VTNRQPPALRLHLEERADEPSSPLAVQIAPLLTAFERATGWELRYEQTPAGIGEVWSTIIDGGDQPDGRLVLASPSPEVGERATTKATIDLPQARPLALALGGLVGEINRLRNALRHREAELAAGVPIAARPNEEPHLAERLEAVLKGGAEAVGCVAAGLYLLDETTTELKLRAGFGLPQERLLAPARPLRGAVADLEALVGHAVVLEDTSLLPHWRPPENFPAAVCVPVSSPSIPLGTLWVFADQERDFTPEETNLLEIVAGRLAADLEREMLLAAGTQAKQRDKQFDAAARWLSDRLPSVTPLLDDYDLAGWTRQGYEIGGDFHDWSVLPDGRLSLAVGDAEGVLLEAALGAASLHSAIKAHAGHPHTVGELMTRVNESLVAASAGDQRASLAYALIEPESGTVELALAGTSIAIVVGPDNRMITTTDAPRLGELAEATFDVDRLALRPGEVLVLVSGGVGSAADEAGQRIGEAAVAGLVAGYLRDSAKGLATRLRRLLDCGQQIEHDMTVLVLKRRRS
jgi:serine phosphatase RsbU (regulator of sigma subunit)